MMRKSWHRVFTVGVGSAVSEWFVRQLAKETGGACELVSPRENMAEKIVHHFRRIYLPRADHVEFQWPVQPSRTAPRIIGPVYDGDTLHIFGFFTEKPQGPVILTMTLADGRTFSQSAIPSDLESPFTDNGLPGALARLGVHEALADMHKSEAQQLALKYQLVSSYTNYIVVAERSDLEKTRELPALRKVPQMLAAGWGGTGSIASERRVMYSLSASLADYDEPTFLRRKQSVSEERQREQQQPTPFEFARRCNDLHANWISPKLQLLSFDDLRIYGLPERVVSALKTIADQYAPQIPEKLIVLAFLIVLLESAIAGEFDRNTRRVVQMACKTLRPNDGLIQVMAEAFADIKTDDWGPRFPQYQEQNE